MPKIDGTSSLITALRSQLATRTELQQPARLSTELARPAPIGPEEIKARIGRELKGLDLKSSVGRRQARKVFLESVLAWDFGEQLLTDPNFSFVVKDVEESLETNPTVSDILDRLLLQLQQVETAS